MNPAPPVICGTLLAALMAAGVSHYWSVEKFIAEYPTTPVVRLLPASDPVATDKIPANPPLSEIPTHQLTENAPAPESAAGKEFFESLIQEMRNLRNENKALTDQIAETNRDVMKMQFQVDSHSASFRPLRTTDDRNDTTYGVEDDYPGVLPPRAEPVYPLDE